MTNIRHRNRCFITDVDDYGRTWRFIIYYDDSHISDEYTRMLGLIRRLWSTCDDFYLPTFVSGGVSGYTNDLTVELQARTSERPQPNCNQAVECTQDPLNINTVIDELRSACSESEHRYIFDVEIKGKCKIRLKDGDHWIDRYHERYKVFKKKKRKILNSDPLGPPVSVRIDHKDDLESRGSVYTIDVSTLIDIWYEDTEIGKINHDRLRTFLGRIYSEFDVQRMKLKL